MMKVRNSKFYNGPISIPNGLKQSKQRFCNLATNSSFDVRNEDKVTEIDIYDEIGYWGVDAKTFRSMLRNADDVKLRIHSPGGDVYDGISMYNDLVEHKGHVDVLITGLAASAASLIAMAGDTIRMAPSSFLMIHNVWTVKAGDRHAMREIADMMEPLDAALAQVYSNRTVQNLAEIVEMMNVETWLSGDDAVDQGFADELTQTDTPKAKFDLSGFKNAPKQWAVEKDARPESRQDHEKILMRSAGYSRSQARALLRDGYGGMRSAVTTGPVMRGADEDLLPLKNLAMELNL